MKPLKESIPNRSAGGALDQPRHVDETGDQVSWRCKFPCDAMKESPGFRPSMQFDKKSQYGGPNILILDRTFAHDPGGQLSSGSLTIDELAARIDLCANFLNLDG
jgi:hypothetical protein